MTLLILLLRLLFHWYLLFQIDVVFARKMSLHYSLLHYYHYSMTLMILLLLLLLHYQIAIESSVAVATETPRAQATTLVLYRQQ